MNNMKSMRRLGLVTLLAALSHSCLTLYDPMDGSLPDSSVHGMSQARILEWVAIFFLQILPTQDQTYISSSLAL